MKHFFKLVMTVYTFMLFKFSLLVGWVKGYQNGNLTESSELQYFRN